MSRLIGALVVCISVAAACGQAPPTSVADRARSIERQVWSPYCPGRLLIDCTTEQAGDLRDDIEDRLQAGQGTERVLEWIRLNYGDEAMARPQSLWIWSFPIGLLMIGGVILVVLVRRWTRRGASTPA